MMVMVLVKHLEQMSSVFQQTIIIIVSVISGPVRQNYSTEFKIIWSTEYYWYFMLVRSQPLEIYFISVTTFRFWFSPLVRSLTFEIFKEKLKVTAKCGRSRDSRICSHRKTGEISLLTVQITVFTKKVENFCHDPNFLKRSKQMMLRNHQYFTVR